MKRILIPLLAALALPIAVNAEVDPKVHNLCKEVTDYMGCVKGNSKNNSWNPFKKTAKKDKSKEEIDLEATKLGRVGLQIYILKEDFIIATVIREGPADKVGIKNQDKIISIDNLSIKGMDINEVIKLLRGQKGTKVSLKIDREGLLINKTLTRDIIDDPLSPVSLFEKPPSIQSLSDSLSGSDTTLGEYDNYFKEVLAEVFWHKGKSYTASQSCPSGQNMYWWISGLRRRKVTEMGCMTPDQYKVAELEWKMKKLNQKVRANSFNNAANSINNLKMQQRINANTYSNSGY